MKEHLSGHLAVYQESFVGGDRRPVLPQHFFYFILDFPFHLASSLIRFNVFLISLIEIRAA